MKSIAIVAMIACTTATAQEAKPLTYKGIMLGTSISEFRALMPAFVCHTDRLCSYSHSSCAGSSQGILTNKAIYDAYSKRSSECVADYTFAGAAIEGGDAIFENGKLREIRLRFSASKMDGIAVAAEQAYGAPSSNIETTSTTNAGVQHPNWVKSWKVGHDTMEMRRLAGDIRFGTVDLLSQESITDKLSKAKAKASQAAQDF